MAPESALSATNLTQSPYKLDPSQTSKASSALLKHIQTPTDILGPTVLPIWLILTTKHHITNHPILKPSKIALPHSLYTTPNLSICLITPSPQRTFKDVVEKFPPEIRKKIVRVIDVVKLKSKYGTAEAQRVLRDSHDVFLADDRIVTFLAKILGKSFYSSGARRPIPIRLEATKHKQEKNAALPSTKKRKEKSDIKSCVSAENAAKEIEKALGTTQVYLNPSVSTSIRVGLSSHSPNELAENIVAVVGAMTEKHVKWKGIQSIHIKGPETAALPIWLASELWTDEADIVEKVEGKRKRDIEGGGQGQKKLKSSEPARKQLTADDETRKKEKEEAKERQARLKHNRQKIQAAIDM